MLNEIPTTVSNRQWMRAAKAWRIFLDIPDSTTLPSVLTAYIDTKLKVQLQSDDGFTVLIDPAFVVDVPSKGRRFQLVVETCLEKQAEIGPKLTAMVGYPAVLTITPLNHPNQDKAILPTTPTGDISQHALKGLHVTFFTSRNFQLYLQKLTGCTINDPITCKSEFKKYLNIESCKAITQRQFDQILSNYRSWLNEGQS